MQLQIIKRISSVFQRKSKAHQTAHQYWKSCANTFLAGDPTYYDRQEVALRAILAGLDARELNGLDVGCGNGRFSLVMGEYLNSVTAFDLSKQLIAEAILKSKASPHVRFQQRDLEDGFPAGMFGVVAGMGIASTLIDEKVFKGFIRDLGKAVAPAGHLITKDSLSTTGTDKAVTSGSYITTYRDQTRYENEIRKAGFTLMHKQELASADGLTNHLYLWKKTP
ncbi:bifunctional 2-polyprenyl-6-hydroxyphenol methylase/3-demethylubiquinol 3-O-methyltransferase UbiG [Achromobacter sp. ACRQX]|uniref:class I SAM-dependent methyltransferase n=1 Tax=Achromobacter sp. ACRQX TaxID=2918181 RepID=UPI001EF3CBB3|nr:class I SAM-dependent methyltransferase [Achromobacter sp. ACRQX]MCG7328071.1 class I SAM-dependent methyltransferase [Achromobacter sp. ACRQX]